MNRYLDALAVTDAHTFDDVNAQLLRLGLTDGLPIVPPVPAKVDAMLAGRDPQAVVGVLAPARGQATLRRIALCAVMAGCRPAYLPILIAAVKAVSEAEFNLLGVQTTTGNVSVMLLVNGPIVKRAELNAEHNALGPGNRANATIGRALNLILRNIGEAVPGKTDMSTMGQPGKYGFCTAENEAANPWEPLHVSRGFAADQSTVTAFAAAGIMEVVDSTSRDGQGVLTTLARSMTIAGTIGGATFMGGGRPLVLLTPEHAAIVARSHSRTQAQAALHKLARLPLSQLSPETAQHLLETEGEPSDPAGDVWVAAAPADILLAVVGGIGIKSAYIPNWGGGSKPTTIAIDA